jgi:6-methylsalicylate decarboxylase
MTRYDVHQHLWSEPLVAALAARAQAPRIRRDGLLWRLDLPSEPSCTVDVDGDDPDRRASLVCLDGLDRALIAPSLALGCEPDVLAAYHEGCEGLPHTFGAWATVDPRTATPAEVAGLLDRGFAGLCLPASALGTAAALEEVGPLLETLSRRDAPLFVHPAGASAPPGAPAWWPAMAGYVPEVHVAWHAWIAHGRTAHPRLRVLWAMLAGGAPLHVERLAARGGPPAAGLDRLSFYDSSSYGGSMLEATARVVGIDRLVHGSDRPVVAPLPAPGPLGEAVWRSMTVQAPATLLGTRAAATTASPMAATSSSEATYGGIV